MKYDRAVGECHKCGSLVADTLDLGRAYTVKRIGAGKFWERDVFVCECCELPEALVGTFEDDASDASRG